MLSGIVTRKTPTTWTFDTKVIMMVCLFLKKHTFSEKKSFFMMPCHCGSLSDISGKPWL